MNTKTTILFFIKAVIILFCFSCIGLLVNSLIKESKDKNNDSIPFLSISDKLVDSIISKLTTDQKIDLVLRQAFDDENSQLDSFSESNSAETQSMLSGVVNYNSLKYHDIVNRKDKFHGVTDDEYFNSITDSLLIINYLKSRLDKANSENYNFLYQGVNISDIKTISDSVYQRFYKSWLNNAIQVFRDEKCLFGNRMNLQYLLLLDSIDKKEPLLVDSLFDLFKNKLDFVFIDSLKNPESFVFQFKGLCIADLSFNSIADESTFIKFLEKDIDVYLIQKTEYQKYRLKFTDLVNSGKYDIEKLDPKLRKILKSKIWSSSQHAANKLINKQTHAVWHQQLVEKSICLLNNPDSIIPIKKIDNKGFIVIWVGKSLNNNFMKYCNEYVPVSSILLQAGQTNWKKKIGKPSKKSFYILVLDTGIENESINQQFVSIINQIDKSALAIVNFKNYQNLPFISDSVSCIQIHSKTNFDYQFAAQALFGGISIEGQLPQSINEHYSFGLKKTSTKTRVKFGLPGNVGVDEEKLKSIDHIVLEGINSGAFPGCQIFVIKNGEVIYDKSFGYHTWSKDEMVKPNDVYDLASVTKIAATTIASMKMVSDRKMSLNDQLGKFFKNTTIDYTRIKPDTLVKIDTFLRADIQNWKKFLNQNDTLNLNDSCFVTIDTVITRLTPKLNIFKVPLVDLLMHKSGIIPATPIFRYMFYREYYIKQLKQRMLTFYGKTNPFFNLGSFELPPSFPDNTNLNDSLKQFVKLGFKKQYQEYFSNHYIKDSSDKIRLTENLFLKNRYFDTIWRDTKQMPVYSRKVVQYSDVNMILLQLAIDSVNRLSVDEYMKKTIYNPLGLRTITYLPLNYYPKNRVIPTEMENSWRFGYLHGYVHDPSSALMGGMVGNAGLYSNARDLGILFQMILNQGNYGGIQYIGPSIIQKYTERNDETQRALGFDMPNMKAAVGIKAPKTTYGHTGYTGTCVWVDPENKLVYVFLSNRNNPSANNWRLNTYKIRERIHDAIYESFVHEKLERGN